MILGRASEVAWWIEERERIQLKHDFGAPRPWTKNKILDTYRFCNVRREQDRVTRWLAKYWRTPYSKHPNLTTAMTLARMINWPPTLAYLGFPEEWNPNTIVKKLREIPVRNKFWTSAYVITTCGKPMDKLDYVVRHVVDAVHKAEIFPNKNDTCYTFWSDLRSIDGLGAGFLAAQVVADMKYVAPLKDAADWWTFAVPGPGSRRGLNRYYGSDPNEPLTDSQWQAGFRVMVGEVEQLLENKVEKIHGQDYQNVLCEWDKYERVANGEGRPRQKYSPEIAYTL